MKINKINTPQKALNIVNERIAAFEEKYQMTSEQMVNKLRLSLIKETEAICFWLMQVELRKRILSCEKI